MASIKLKQSVKIWPQIAPLISVPHTEADYEEMVTFLDELIDEVGEDESHPLASLMETLGTLIEAYEAIYVPEPIGDPLTSLNLLMDEHGLDHNNLPEIGDGKTVNAILAGKHPLNVKQIYALGERFGVSPTVFV